MKIGKAGAVARKFGLVVAAMFCLLILLAGLTNVSTDIERDDVDVFEGQFNLVANQQPMTFAEEILAIKAIQHQVMGFAPVGAGIPEFSPREPLDLLKMRSGLCFDRSRTLDKAYKFIGLPTRHVFLMYRGNRSLIGSLLSRKLDSHAVTEVKTSKGWMFVDSNSEWIGLTRDGQPVNADDVWKRADEFEDIPAYLKEPWWAIRGMYSRHGKFFEPHIPFPELNWPVFFRWLIYG